MKRSLFGVSVPLISRETLFAHIDRGQRCMIATLNPELMLEAYRNPSFKATLNTMDFATVDGTGLSLILHTLGYQSPHRYPGANLLTDLIMTGHNCYFLGGLENQAKGAKEYAEHTWPSAHIVGAESGGKIDHNQLILDQNVLKRINESGATVLLVGFGAPRQELWITAALPHLPHIKVAVGIGGAFGFLGQKPRAPKMWRSLGLEWLYRGFYEKKHWKRIWQAVVLFPLTALSWQLRQVLSRHG